MSQLDVDHYDLKKAKGQLIECALITQKAEVVFGGAQEVSLKKVIDDLATGARFQRLCRSPGWLFQRWNLWCRH